MYVQELRDFREYLIVHTDVEELKSLNLLGVQYPPGNRGMGLVRMRLAKEPGDPPPPQLSDCESYEFTPVGPPGCFAKPICIN